METILEPAYVALKKYFGFEEFRPMQKDVIINVLEGNNALVLMPTGGGKSICFQIPALIQDGMAVVVSPLIALMKDQVEGLIQNGIKAAFMNSTQSISQLETIEGEIRIGRLKLLYVSPEKLLTENFLNFLSKQNINLFAIDEAHCISQWGHDFRPEYTQMAKIKDRFPNVPIIALTATADRLTRKDILEQLKIQDAQIFISSFDRPNISLKVLPAQKRTEQIVQFIKKRPYQSGIVYCLSRKGTEGLAEELRSEGIKAMHYHAGMTNNERAKVQNDFIKDNCPVICATIAFGMGIDKPNVRWVIHYNMPKSVESYYQEIGRAGRDGLASEAILFYSFGDVVKLRDMIEENTNKEVELAKLERMQQFADAQLCRRKILLAYFNENLENNCGNCDVCQNPPQIFDGTIIVQKALSAIKRTEEKTATGLLIDVLRGSAKQEVIEKGYHLIKTYGVGRDISAFDWQNYLLQMLNLGLIEIAYDDHHHLKLTQESQKVLFQGKKVHLVHPSVIEEAKNEKVREAIVPKTKELSLKEELFDSLRALRKNLADEEGVAPFIIFNDVSLKEMSETKPVTLKAFSKITGVGEVKLEKYADIFIEHIIEFILRKTKEGVKIMGATYLETFNLLKNGYDIEKIATQRKLSTETILVHIAHLYEHGFKVKIYDYISKEDISIVLNAIKKIKWKEEQGLKILLESLESNFTYGKIELALAYQRKNK
jgi:ATP-dependent DNA helicase RecQ